MHYGPSTLLSLHPHPLQYAFRAPYQEVRSTPWIWVSSGSCPDQLNEMKGTMCRFWASASRMLLLVLFQSYHHHINKPELASGRRRYVEESQESSAFSLPTPKHVRKHNMRKRKHLLEPQLTTDDKWARPRPEDSLNPFMGSWTKLNECCFRSLSLDVA